MALASQQVPFYSIGISPFKVKDCIQDNDSKGNGILFFMQIFLQLFLRKNYQQQSILV